MGIPIEYMEDEIPGLLAESGWLTTLIPASRKVRGHVSSLRVRALQPPAHPVIRVIAGSEVITLHVREFTTGARQEKSEPIVLLQLGCDAAKMALGKDSSAAEHQSPTAQARKHPRDPSTHVRSPRASREEDWWEQQYYQYDLFAYDEEDSEDPIEDIEIENDAHVEGPPRQKRRCRATPHRAKQYVSQSSKRMKVLEAGACYHASPTHQLDSVLSSAATCEPSQCHHPLRQDGCRHNMAGCPGHLTSPCHQTAY